MAGSRRSIQKLLDRHKLQISKELDPSQSGLIGHLTKKGVFSVDEEKQLMLEQNVSARGDLFVEILAKKGFNAFREMCVALELECPHLLTSLLLDSTGKMIFKFFDFFFREMKEKKCMQNVFSDRMNQIALFILHTRTSYVCCHQ